jgi:hypothetical protein
MPREAATKMKFAFLLFAVGLCACAEQLPPQKPIRRFQILSVPFRENDPAAREIAVWRLDTVTGALEFCEANNDLPFSHRPVCSDANVPS